MATSPRVGLYSILGKLFCFFTWWESNPFPNISNYSGFDIIPIQPHITNFIPFHVTIFQVESAEYCSFKETKQTYI